MFSEDEILRWLILVREKWWLCFLRALLLQGSFLPQFWPLRGVGVEIGPGSGRGVGLCVRWWMDWQTGDGNAVLMMPVFPFAWLTGAPASDRFTVSLPPGPRRAKGEKRGWGASN